MHVLSQSPVDTHTLTHTHTHLHHTHQRTHAAGLVSLWSVFVFVMMSVMSVSFHLNTPRDHPSTRGPTHHPPRSLHRPRRPLSKTSTYASYTDCVVSACSALYGFVFFLPYNCCAPPCAVWFPFNSLLGEVKPDEMTFCTLFRSESFSCASRVLLAPEEAPAAPPWSSPSPYSPPASSSFSV